MFLSFSGSSLARGPTERKERGPPGSQRTEYTLDTRVTSLVHQEPWLPRCIPRSLSCFCVSCLMRARQRIATGPVQSTSLLLLSGSVVPDCDPVDCSYAGLPLSCTISRSLLKLVPKPPYLFLNHPLLLVNQHTFPRARVFLAVPSQLRRLWVKLHI